MEVRSRRTDCEVAGHNQSSGITGAPESPVRRGQGCRVDCAQAWKKNEPVSATASRSGASAKWETTERGL